MEGVGKEEEDGREIKPEKKLEAKYRIAEQETLWGCGLRIDVAFCRQIFLNKGGWILKDLMLLGFLHDARG